MYQTPDKGRFYHGFEEFHERLDFTEVYYNLGFLNYEQGDFDLSMYYFAMAGKSIYFTEKELEMIYGVKISVSFEGMRR